MDHQIERSFAAACREFFGMRAEETLQEFMQEIKALTDADKEEIRDGLIENGIAVKPL